MGAFPEEARKFGGLNTQGHADHLQDFGLCPEGSPVMVGFSRSRQAPSSGRSPELPIQSVPHLPLISITTDHQL